jgi:hypothetical protein
LVESVLTSEVRKNVRLLGELPSQEIKKWMAMSDVIVVTSITEGTKNNPTSHFFRNTTCHI